jgi:hypothetical protein
MGRMPGMPRTRPEHERKQPDEHHAPGHADAAPEVAGAPRWRRTRRVPQANGIVFGLSCC